MIEEIEAKDRALENLRAEVARLEGELAEAQTKYDRLLFTHDEVTLPMLYEADERLKTLEAEAKKQERARSLIEEANAAMAAALRGYLRATGGDFCCVCYKPHSNFKRPSSHEPWCQRAKAWAALSDASKGKRGDDDT